jgi:hypothetical protein
MPYRVEIGNKANAQLSELDAAIGLSVERKIQCQYRKPIKPRNTRKTRKVLMFRVFRIFRGS